jgi:hypothetical protein
MSKMRKRLLHLIVVGVGLVAIALWIVICFPSPPPQRVLTFTLTPLFSSNTVSANYLVVVSNASDCPAQIEGRYNITTGVSNPAKAFAKDGERLHFVVHYVTNGAWRIDPTQDKGHGTIGILAPHDIAKSVVTVPAGASSFKIGMDIISLSWRGRLAWIHMPAFLENILGPFAGRLLRQDQHARSKTEWSEEYQCGDITNLDKLKNTQPKRGQKGVRDDY